MEIAGKPMNPKEWRLYTTRRDTPRQREDDCGLYAVLFGMCVAMRLPLTLLSRGRIRAARFFLLLHLIDLQPERAEPLGEVDEFKPKYDKEEKCLSPDTPSRELADDSGGPVVDLLTPPTKNAGATIESTDSVLDLITPDKNPIQETNELVTDLVTPPTKRQLDLSVNDSGEGGGGGGTGASQEADSAGASGDNKNQDEAEKSKGSDSAQGGGGSSSGNTAVGCPNASGGGADDGGKDSDDNDGDEKNDDEEKDPKSKKDKPKKSPPAGKKDDKDRDSGTEGKDKKEVNEDVGELPIISGIILPFVDSTGVTKKNHGLYGLYGKAIQEHSKKNNKTSRSKLKKRKDIFQKSWATYQQRLAKYIDKGEKHEDEDVCVACAEMADKKIVWKKCNVCVHPVVPCSHTIEKECFCESCFSLPSDNPSTTSKKDAPSKPGASPQLEDEADPKVKAKHEASGRLPQPEDDEEDANPNLEEESNKKKKKEAPTTLQER
jgi:hypothetical protein